jgi:hypothetical protein
MKKEYDFSKAEQGKFYRPKKILAPKKKITRKANALLDVDKITIDTGISDLSSQHDHYLYSVPKK